MGWWLKLAKGKRPHRFDAHAQEIADLLAEGKTYIAVEDYLFDKYGLNAPASELCVWCKAKGIRHLVTDGRHKDKVPHCANCENYVEIGTKHIYKKTPIRVCKACLECIPNNVISSPIWCSKRI